MVVVHRRVHRVSRQREKELGHNWRSKWQNWDLLKLRVKVREHLLMVSTRWKLTYPACRQGKAGRVLMAAKGRWFSLHCEADCGVRSCSSGGGIAPAV